MIIPKNYEELAEIVKSEGKHVLFFTAGWCPDCTFIKPKMPELRKTKEEVSEFLKGVDK